MVRVRSKASQPAKLRSYRRSSEGATRTARTDSLAMYEIGSRRSKLVEEVQLECTYRIQLRLLLLHLVESRAANLPLQDHGSHP